MGNRPTAALVAAAAVASAAAGVAVVAAAAAASAAHELQVRGRALLDALVRGVIGLSGRARAVGGLGERAEVDGRVVGASSHHAPARRQLEAVPLRERVEGARGHFARIAGAYVHREGGGVGDRRLRRHRWDLRGTAGDGDQHDGAQEHQVAHVMCVCLLSRDSSTPGRFRVQELQRHMP